MTYEFVEISEDDRDGFNIVAKYDRDPDTVVTDEYNAGDISINGGHTFSVDGRAAFVGSGIEIEERHDQVEGLVKITL